MILKKSQKSEATQEAKVPKQQAVGRIGKKFDPPPAEETDDTDCETSAASTSEPKIRLSTDIDEQAYINLKCYATITRKSVVSILNNLIYTHCHVKISM